MYMTGVFSIKYIVWYRIDKEVAGRQHSFVENDHEIFSTVILSHWFKKSTCQFLANECAQCWLMLRELSLSSKSVLRCRGRFSDVWHNVFRSDEIQLFQVFHYNVLFQIMLCCLPHLIRGDFTRLPTAYLTIHFIEQRCDFCVCGCLLKPFDCDCSLVIWEYSLISFDFISSIVNDHI